MKKPAIIIPSAKLVPGELQKIGKLPGIIYPVNQHIVFDFLYQQYAEISSEMNVICCESAELVRKRLSSYKEKKIRVSDLDRLGDLGDTVYKGLENITSPVIIHFGDTIVFDNIYEEAGDAFFYTEDYISKSWTYFEIEEGVIVRVYDKVEAGFQGKKKLFVGVFQITDCICFRKCLEEAFSEAQRDMNSFYYALCLYSRRHPLKDVAADNWFDVGHAGTYYDTKLEVKAREFNHIIIDRNRGVLTKTSDDKEKLIGEILWYLKLPADIEYVHPRIFSYSIEYANPSVSMEYYAYHTLHELFLYGDLEKRRWADIFSRIKFVCDDLKRYRVKDDHLKESLEDIYLKKTLERLRNLERDERFSAFFENRIIVNNHQYRSLNEIAGILKMVIPDMLYQVDHFSIIHGDLCFSNIMVDETCSFIKVIDPRGKFGKYDIYGDFRYELAKLLHSIDGKYDFIIKDLFTAEYDLSSARITYQIFDRYIEFDVYGLFTEIFSKEIGGKKKEIELIEALLFLSMVPLHGESLDHQVVMLATGLDILSRVVDIRAEGGDETYV